jgi:hypothetical protein
MGNWAIEDFEDANPETEGQRGLLRHLLKIRATNLDQLGAASERLEALGSPYVAVFCQVPYKIDTASVALAASGTRDGIGVEMHFSPSRLVMDEHGETRLHDEAEGLLGREVTNVTAFVRLWDKRARLHKLYAENINKPALADMPISKIESWMDLPEAQMALPVRRSAMLTLSRFRSEVARRLRYEVLAAVNRVARSTSILTLTEYPELKRLYGYFAMLTPMEIAGATVPIPIQQFFFHTESLPVNSHQVDLQRLTRLLGRSNYDKDARHDLMVAQLIAMNSLRRYGEPELALMGCATALEWFLNEHFPQVAESKKVGRRNNASLSDFGKAAPLRFLGDETQKSLISLAHARNRVAHGKPRARVTLPLVDSSRSDSSPDSTARDWLFFALEVYRRVNLAENDQKSR